MKRNKNNVMILFIVFYVNAYSQINRYDQPKGQNYTETYVPINFEIYEKAIKERQQAKNQEGKKNVNALIELYNTATNYPIKITDGIHEVEITDNLYEVGTLDVYVTNNKVTHLIKDGIKGEVVPFSTDIVNGKCTVKLFVSGQDLGYWNVYFIKDIFK